MLSKNKVLTWPIAVNDINDFTHWALTEKGLKSGTVKSYLKSIELQHSLRNCLSPMCLNPVNTLMLKGAENMQLYSQPSRKNKNVMTLSLLKIVGHEISATGWSVFNKQTVWTAALLAFFGSFRMGELLCTSLGNFDAASNLTWGDIKFLEKSVLIHVKSPKSKNIGGDFVDIFDFKGHNCCPRTAISKYKAMTVDSRMYNYNGPVFKFDSGKIMTKNCFNRTISDLLSHSSVKLDVKITGHSFRAAIPAMLAKFPEISSNEHIMGWGRWGSKAYLSYTRLKLDQKLKIFEKIVSVLNFSGNKKA